MSTESITGTSLQAMTRHCLHALDHRDGGTLRDERYFAAGIAAHAILEAFHRWHLKYPGAEMKAPTREEVAHQVVLHLSGPHPGYRGAPTPPLPLDRVQEGRTLAMIWTANHPIFKGEPEARLACDDKWRPTTDPKASAYRGILDVLDYEEGAEIDPDDGITANILTIEDYKTGWHTSEEECTSPQQRLYRLLALAHYPQTTLLIVKIHNLRTGQTFTDSMWIDDAGEAILNRWRREIEEARTIAAIRGPDGARPATPGAGCVGCPWVRSCQSAATILADVDPSTLATRYAVSRALTESLADQLRDACNEGAIPVPGGAVGYKEVIKNEAAKNAALLTMAAWDRANNPDLDPTDPVWLANTANARALIDALRIGAGNLKDLVISLFPKGRGKSAKEANMLAEERRKTFLATVLTPAVSSAFGVHPNHKPDGNEDRPLTPSERQEIDTD